MEIPSFRTTIGEQEYRFIFKDMYQVPCSMGDEDIYGSDRVTSGTFLMVPVKNRETEAVLECATTLANIAGNVEEEEPVFSTPVFSTPVRTSEMIRQELETAKKELERLKKLRDSSRCPGAPVKTKKRVLSEMQTKRTINFENSPNSHGYNLRPRN